MNEQPLLFGESRALFGILGLPDEPDLTRPAIIIPNNGTDHRTGPGRIHVELARALALAGFVSLRMDLAGLGDSDVVPGKGTSEFAPDLRAAMDALDARSVSQGYVLIGFGAGANEVHQAARVDPRIVGAVFYDGYRHATPRYWLKRTLDRIGSGARPLPLPPQRGLTLRSGEALHDVLPQEIHYYDTPNPKQMQADLAEFMRRRLSLLFVFTGQVEHEYNYPTQLLDAFPILRAYPLLTLHHLPDADHAFGRRASRETVIGLLLNWLQALPKRS